MSHPQKQPSNTKPKERLNSIKTHKINSQIINENGKSKEDKSSRIDNNSQESDYRLEEMEDNEATGIQNNINKQSKK